MRRSSHGINPDGSFLSLDVLRLAWPFVPLLFAILLRLRSGRNFLLRRSPACGSPFSRPAPSGTGSRDLQNPSTLRIAATSPKRLTRKLSLLRCPLNHGRPALRAHALDGQPAPSSGQAIGTETPRNRGLLRSAIVYSTDNRKNKVFRREIANVCHFVHTTVTVLRI